MVALTHIQTAQAQEVWRSKVISVVQPGAVVARRGLDSDTITQAVLLGQGGGKWSHVGIALQLIPDGQIYIASAMPSAGTKLEKPEVFFDERQASNGAVIPTPIDKSEAVQNAVKSMLGRPFDDQLRLDDGGQKLYCTELVALALQQAKVIKNLPTRSIFSREIITPDDLVAAVEGQ